MPVLIDPSEYTRSLIDMRRNVDGPDLKYPVETRLTDGDPAGEILVVAKKLGCSLIVMGTHGRSGLGRLLMGSVAEAVVRGASCPVLAVKSSVAADHGVELPSSLAMV
jgi:nucleotide-binding universal stress UspA family protein